MAVDPVCHKEIHPQKSAGHAEHLGHKYYFCSRSCEKSFRANPEYYTRHHKSGSLHPVKVRVSCHFTAF